MFRSSPLSSRGQFGDYLNSLNLLDYAVEVGTHRGDYAECLLRCWKGDKLYCIDPWENPPGYEEQAALLWGGAKTRDEDMEETRRVLSPYPGRFELLEGRSDQIVHDFALSSLDFVYVDGDHRYESVLYDLLQWYPRLKIGGILAGHDFIQPGEAHSWAGEIQKAVLEFSSQFSLDVHLIVEEGGLPWSYYMIKSW